MSRTEQNSADAEVQRLVESRDIEQIAGMFDAISPRYDRMNRVMTFGQDVRWRRHAADAARLRSGDKALDVATGTGDLARELASRVSPGGEVVGVDIAESMLDIARRKAAGNSAIRFQTGDVHDLDFDADFNAATVAFGFRNFTDRQRGVDNMAKVVKRGGRVVVLEIIPTQSRLRVLTDFYETRGIPIIARVLGADARAYQYLPRSVAASATKTEIEQCLRQSGLKDIASRTFNLGTIALVSGLK
ncbi:MAG TPA: ubiquinone/menaquinone biosynthesis methyltransferase [Chloroflexota bacterium]|nr:ubiquinone/menaquinone biosynthesis methyltransferase [Chloroflexota bacterium]